MEPTKRSWTVSIEGALVLGALTSLTALDVVTGKPWFQDFPHARLTFLTLLLLPLFLMVTLARRRWQRLSQTLGDWWVVVMVLAVYESLKHMHANRITEALGIPPLDWLMLRGDQIVFGKALPLYFDVDSWSAPWFTHVMWFFYISVYYAFPALLLAYVYFVVEDDTLFRRLRRGLITVLLGGYVIYLLVPVAGPLFLIGDQFVHPIRTQPTLQTLAFSTLRYNWDCFPSLHTAVPWLLTVLVWSRARWWLRTCCLVAATGVTVSTVALRFHYGVDLVAGLIWAAAVALLIRATNHRSWSFRIPGVPVIAPLTTGNAHLGLVTGLFVVSGFVALLVEQGFEKMLQPLVGASGYSAAAVLSIYFIGLSLGGALYGRWFQRRSRRPLRTYAFLEGGVALYAVLLYIGYDHLLPIFVPLLKLGAQSFWLLQICRLAVSAIWILPVTFLMGATFPAVADAVECSGTGRPDKIMTLAYGANIAGACAAAVLAPYRIFPYWGVDGALLIAFALDMGVFLAAFRLDMGKSPDCSPFREDRGDPVPFSVLFSRRLIPLSAVALLSGFIFFSLEVLWSHLIGTVLGTSVYAFSVMLTLVLFGLGIGAWLAAVAYRKDARMSPAVPGQLLLLGAITVALTHDGWPHIPHSLAVWGEFLETFGQGELLRWVHAFILIVPSSIALGMVFPALFRLDLFPERFRGAAAGKLAALNAVGCIAGALFTGFVLIPTIGSEALSLTLMILCTISGASLAILYGSQRERRRILVLSVIAVTLVGTRPPWDRLALTSGEQVYLRSHQVFPESKLLFFQEDTAGGMTTVVWNPEGVKGQPRPYLTLLTNGKFQGNDAWEREAQIGLAVVPAMFTSHFDRALVIGLGTGQSARVIRDLGFQQTDIAEIAPGIVETAKTYFSRVNGGVVSSASVRVHLEDGRNFLLLHDSTYDLITMEISSIWFAGATNLYSQDFYRLASSRLNPGGVFQQWVQLHHISPLELSTAIATIRTVFPQVSVWVVGGQGVLVATHGQQRLSAAFFGRYPHLAETLGAEAHDDGVWLIARLLKSRLLAPSDVDDLVIQLKPKLNTDRNRLLEYWTPRYNVGRSNWVQANLTWLGGWATSPPILAEPSIAQPYSDLIDTIGKNGPTR